MAKKWIFAGLIAVGIYALLSGESFIRQKGLILASVSQSVSSDEGGELAYLKGEKERLEIELLNSRCSNDDVLKEREGISAKVYSGYPFADKSEILINVGLKNGIEVGSVVVANNSLVGKIKEVYRETSIVSTVMDQGMKIPARIGEKEIDALYVGGLHPRLELIDSKEPIVGGEIIISADPNLPYGLGLGKTTSVKDGLIKEADIEPAVEIKSLRDVSVIKSVSR